ncbi:20231_t:CDS:2, partial [Gigaspora margarita]
GYKFRWDQGCVYIVDMANMDHASVLMDYFKVPNNGVIRGPMKAIITRSTGYPLSTYVARPNAPYPGPQQHKSNTQDILTWNTRCEFWVRKQHVRYVFGIKLDIWDLLYGTDNPTACIRTGLLNYQVTIPISAVFWDPPIVIDAITGTNTVGIDDYIWRISTTYLFFHRIEGLIKEVKRDDILHEEQSTPSTPFTLFTRFVYLH